MRHTKSTTAILLTSLLMLTLQACTTTPPLTDETLPLNYLQVSERLVTSGQPSAQQIAALSVRQYRLVIDLAPSDNPLTSHEAYLLGQKGIAYAAIPVSSDQPSYRDFRLFSKLLEAVGKAPVWVHCRANNRASMFTFLYRVIHEGADPDSAYESVTLLWVPTPHWVSFARETLAQHHISYAF